MEYEKIDLKVSQPKNFDEVVPDFFIKTTSIFKIQICRYKGIYVTNSGVAFDKRLGLLPGSYLDVPRIKREQKKIAIGSFLLKKKRRANPKLTYALVHDHWFGGYYHWLIETLPRLYKIYHSDIWFTLLLPERVKSIPFIIESLALFPSLEIEYIKQKELLFIQDLLLPSHLPGDGLIEPESLNFLKNSCKLEPGSKRERIYISRKKAPKRKVVNEEMVMNYLARYGFKEIVLEELSFCEQIDLFKSAQIVISMHGAGLANIVFMEPDSCVIEILKRPAFNEKYSMCYQMLASVYRLQYYCLVTESLNERDRLFDSNLVVNVDELDKIFTHDFDWQRENPFSKQCE